MKKLIFTWSPPSALCAWQKLDANGNREDAPRTDEPLSELAAQAAGCELIWLAPGQHFLSMTASLPVKSRDKLLRALPYALEEHFAEDPGRLFFALPSSPQGSKTQTIAAEREWLRAALDTLSAEGIQPQRVVPDYLALPRQADGWTVLADAGWLYVRSGPAGGFTLEADTGWALLERRLASLDESERPQAIRLIRGREPYGSGIELDTMTADPELLRDGLFGIAPEGFAQPLAMDLLQGPFKRGSEWRKAAKPWLPAAWALAAVVLLAIVGFSASWVHNAQFDARLDRQVRQLYSQLFPNQEWYGNSTTRRLIRARLSNADGGHENDLLSLLAVLASAAPDNVNIESLSYQAGSLQIRLHAPDVASLDAIRSAISTKSRVPVKIRSVNQTSEGVNGALTLGAGAGS
ncbi:MAG: type II secretion system protein GspL [Gammaproteobacteria bacterium]|nr:type II secretion system protein GspL [Gammaproteobacteria bacterium]